MMKKVWICSLLALVLLMALSTAAFADGSITITQQPSDITAAIGATGSATVEASGVSAYQWYFKAVNSSVWKASGMKGNKTATIYVPVTTARLGQQYKCVLTDEAGNTVETNAVAVVSANPSTITIDTQPEDIRAVIGKSGSATVKASSDAALTYQWYFKSVKGPSWSASGMTGAKTATITVPVTKARIGQQYKCVITTADGGRIESEVVTILEPDPSVITIESQTEEMYGVIGEDASATVVASADTGAALRYCWYVKTPNSTQWKASGMTGCKTATITVPVTKARIGQQYKCLITTADGGRIESDVVTITGKADLALSITDHPANVTTHVGQPILLEISVSGENAKYPLTYQWYRNGVAIAGANSREISFISVQPENAGTYYCVVSGWGYELTSNVGTVTVLE